MIFADKIIALRKRCGWSQEELAEKMNVSRQAVSKWESAQATPDLEKILQLSELFRVSTDYLLKDGAEDESSATHVTDAPIKKITSKEAEIYLNERKRASHKIAIATFLCIISPIPLIILSAATESGFSETLAAVIGLISLFAFVLCAVPLYIYCGFKNEPYAFLEKDVPFELESDATALVTERKNKFRSIYVKANILATCICILSPLPLIVSAFSENVLLIAAMVGLTMVIVGIGVMLYITVGTQHTSMQKLLLEGEYTEDEKKKSQLCEAANTVYWCTLVAIYLVWSFLADSWHISWIVFAVGGALSPLVAVICNRLASKKQPR